MKRSHDTTLTPPPEAHEFDSYEEVQSKKNRHRDYLEVEQLVPETSFLSKNFVFNQNAGVNGKLLRFDYLIGRSTYTDIGFHEILSKSTDTKNLLIFFFNPHFTFLEIMVDFFELAKPEVSVIGVTCVGSLQCNTNFPIIINGETLVRKLHLLDPLGGGKYPRDCCLVINSHGDLKNEVNFGHRHDYSFVERLLHCIEEEDIVIDSNTTYETSIYSTK